MHLCTPLLLPPPLMGSALKPLAQASWQLYPSATDALLASGQEPDDTPKPSLGSVLELHGSSDDTHSTGAPTHTPSVHTIVLLSTALIPSAQPMRQLEPTGSDSLAAGQEPRVPLAPSSSAEPKHGANSAGSADSDPLLHCTVSDPLASAYPSAMPSVHWPPSPLSGAAALQSPGSRPEGSAAALGALHCCRHTG